MISFENFLSADKTQRELLVLGTEVLKDVDNLKKVVGKNVCVDTFLYQLSLLNTTYAANFAKVCDPEELRANMLHVVKTSFLLDMRKEKFGV